MVVGIKKPYTHKSKNTPYVEEYGPPLFFSLTKAASWLWCVMVVGIVHPHTRNRKCTHMLKYVSPRGLYLNIKGLLLLSNQDGHEALVWYDESY